MVKILNLPIILILIVRDLAKGFFPRKFAIWRLRKASASPITFQQKILYKIARDRKDLLKVFADKYKSREYVEKKIGSEYLIPLIAILDGSDRNLLSQLPRNYVIKPNNYSGVVLIVSENAPASSKLPNVLKLNVNQRYIVHPDSIDLFRLRILVLRWLSLDYYRKRGQYPEWAYKNIKSRILIEKFIGDESGVASDYRFFVFNGVCQYIEVGTSWNEAPTRTMYDRDWNRQYVKLKYPARTPEPQKPENLSIAIELAEKLAQDTDHLRVDFYIIRNQIFFGELTNYHTGGQQVFEPQEFNLKFGQSWQPELLY